MVDDWVGLREASQRPGLRLVLLRGFPSPWSQAARAIFEIKRVPFLKVHRADDDPPELLAHWTQQHGFPVAMYQRERPRAGWAEILFLAERLGPLPPLVPSDFAERISMFGFAHAILGEMGLAWCRRLIGLAPHLESRPDDPEVATYRYRYGSEGIDAMAAANRVTAILRGLVAQLRRQEADGSAFLVGSRLSAADIQLAATVNLFAPLSDDALPLPEPVRENILRESEPVRHALDPILLRHQQSIYRRFLRLPVEI